MSVRLISITKPVDLHMTTEDLIAYFARVSNPRTQNNKETAPKLVEYLIKNKHWSPFEMAHLAMEINTTRDISRQMLRHRSFSFQETSQRYSKVNQIALRECRLQDHCNRQNSIPCHEGYKHWLFSLAQRFVGASSLSLYQQMLWLGVAKEQARAILPEGLIPTRLYMAGSLRSWIHYCELRRGNGTQKEHAEIAEQCWQIILSEFPSLGEYLNG